MGTAGGCGEGGDTRGGVGWHSPASVSPRTLEVAEVTRGRASARGPAISETCPAILGTIGLSHRPDTEGTPPGEGGTVVPRLLWALRCPQPPSIELGPLKRGSPGGGREDGPGEDDTTNNLREGGAEWETPLAS